MKFRILVETENLTIQGVEDKEFKERNGRKGLQELKNLDIDIWADIVNNPIPEDI